MFKCFLQAIPAAAAWLIIGLIRVSSRITYFHMDFLVLWKSLELLDFIKGVFYTCALWPEEIDCIPLTNENVTKSVKACHIPKTYT